MTLVLLPQNRLLISLSLSLLLGMKAVLKINAGNVQDLNDSLPILLCKLCLNYSSASRSGQSREIIYVAVGPLQPTYMEEKHTQENK